MFAVKQNEWHPVSLRNAFQRAPEDRGLFVADHVIDRQRFGRMSFRDILKRFSLMIGFAAFAAEKIIDPVPGNATKPGPELLAFPQMAEPLPGDNKGFLRKVFALAEVAGGAVSQGAKQG